MAFTPYDDLNIIQPSDSAIVSAGAGDDIYIIDGGTINSNQQITISDTEGLNTLRLTSGLSITSSSVTSNATQLTLDNGAQITLLGADSFSFELGGSGLGASPVVQNFEHFAADSLGVSIPGVGEAPVAGGSVEVSDDGSTGGGGEIVKTDIPITSDTMGEAGVAENFTYAIDSSSGSVLSQLSSDVTLSGFTVGEDSLTFVDVANGTTTTESFVGDVVVSSSPINDLTNIIFDENASGNSYELVLAGIVDSDLSTVDMSVV